MLLLLFFDSRLPGSRLPSFPASQPSSFPASQLPSLPASQLPSFQLTSFPASFCPHLCASLPCPYPSHTQGKNGKLQRTHEFSLKRYKRNYLSKILKIGTKFHKNKLNPLEVKKAKREKSQYLTKKGSTIFKKFGNLATQTVL
jgi:hypothetical protein